MHASPHVREYRTINVAILAIAVVFAGVTVWRGMSFDSSLPHSEVGDHAQHAPAHAEASGDAKIPHLLAVLPFVILLAAIAVLPMIPATAPWWEHNLHRFYVAAGLSLITVAYYCWGHPLAGWSNVEHLIQHAIVDDYIPFIVLLFALFTISGGIRISGDLLATPLTNTAFLATGGLLASLIGTTGAAMLLIRPVLETNAERRHVQHTIVFFIFIVCNCGGCLLPIGDPPLFLGYLKGVPFLWTLVNLWPHWLIVNGALLVAYYVFDRWVMHPREGAREILLDIERKGRLRLEGIFPNAWLLLGVVLCVALLDPSKSFPGLAWHPPKFCREVAQLLLVAISLHFGSRAAREANQFNFHAIVEVAALFIGIFLCMQPALEILGVRGASLGLAGPHEFFWATGTLSSVLDNAPTYVVFFETAASAPEFAGHTFAELVSQTGELADSARSLLIAISAGSVFMGSMTYIGNGPNFMVRAIAEQAGVKMPSFFGYALWYSIPWLVPLFFLANRILF